MLLKKVVPFATIDVRTIRLPYYTLAMIFLCAIAFRGVREAAA
jgi:hypothetical protein